MLTFHAIEGLFKMGCKKASLVTRTFNKRARSMYSGMGFHMDIEDDGDQFTHFSITPEAFKKAKAAWEAKKKKKATSSRVIPQPA